MKNDDQWKNGYRSGYDAAMAQARGTIQAAQNLYDRQSAELTIVLRALDRLRPDQDSR